MFLTTKRFLVVLALVLHNGLLLQAQDSLCLFPTFYQTLGVEGVQEYAPVLLRSSDNHLYLAGRRGNQTFLRKMDLSGQALWTRAFQVNAFEPVTPVQLIEDSEGMIVGCGTQGITGLSKGFVFRYNPNTNQFLWARSVSSNNPIVGGILEPTPGGNFLLYQNNVLISGETEAEIIEITRATGAVNPGLSKRYEYIFSDVFTKMIAVNGDLYLTGWATSRHNTTVNARRQLLMRIDPGTLDPIWAHLNHLDTLAPISFAGRDLIVDGDALISAYGGGQEFFLNGSTTDTLYLQKTDLNGNIEWVRQYNLVADVVKLLAVPDGYLIFGQRENNQHIVLKTDTSGAPLWARRLIDGAPGNLSVDLFGPNQAVVVNDSIYYAGTGSTNNFDIVWWKMLSDGSMEDTCQFIEPLPVESALVNQPFRTIAEFSQVFSTAASTTANPPLFDLTLDAQQICPACDTLIDLCPQGNDFALQLGGVVCTEGKINLQYTVCDLDGGALDQLNISFYNSDPFTTAADRIYNFSFNPVTSDSCHQGTLLDIVPKLGVANTEPGDVLYAVVNVPNGADTPLDPNDYPAVDQEECNYANNLATFTLVFPQFPTLNLGPDQTVCPGAGLTINAGAGFFKYQWSNGPTTQSINVNFSGQYRLTVTDDCGFRQVDTINVTVLPTPTEVVNGAFCPGRSVTIKGFTFDEAGVFQQTVAGINGDCDTIVTFFIDELPYENRNEIVRFCPGETVTINGVTYEDSGLAIDTINGTIGCDTIVFYFLQQLPAPFRFVQVFICPGDSVLLNGAYYSDQVIVTDTIPSLTSNGCDTLIQYSILFKPTVILSELVQFCQGNSVEINGQTYTQPGQVDVILAGNGAECDSIKRYTLEWLPTPTKAETIRFCQGSSVELGGNLYTDPGEVQLLLPGSGGSCDTLATYTLEWLPTPTRDEDLLFCPGTSVTIGGVTYTQPGTVQTTIPGNGSDCDTLLTYHLAWLPFQADTQTVVFCPGQSVTIGGQVYTQPGTVLDTLSSTAGDCDVIVTYILEFRDLPTRAQTIEFCNGETVTLGGQSYNQPGTVVLTEPGANGACDTVVTYTLQWVVLEPSSLSVTCPFNVNVITSPGTGPIAVNYDLPTAASDCACPGIEWTLTQGQPSGSLFQPGMTKICYTGRDNCGSTANCCFDVIVREEAPCETKVNGCIRYDIMSITADAQQRRTYKIRVTNNCSSKLIYTAIQLPNGIIADQPGNNTIYTAPEGWQYLVRNPNYIPFYSIRFRSGLDSIVNGQSATFQFTLPAQAQPTFFQVSSRLAPQTFVAAHLNTFNCPIGVTQQNRTPDAPVWAEAMPADKAIFLFPNPTAGILFADLSDWDGQQLDLRIFDSRGSQVQQLNVQATTAALPVPLPEAMPAGLYFMEVIGPDGEKDVVRFIKQ